MSEVIVYHRHDYREMPWKNGGGSTCELLIEPPGASLAEATFAWRISMATIRQSGPFSAFPGFDRHIMSVSGGRVSLHHGAGHTKVLVPLVPYAFPGEDPMTCTVEDEAVDFNVMVRREQAEASVTCHALAAGESLRMVVDQNRTLVFCVEGSFDVILNDRIFSLMGHDLLDIPEKHAYGVIIRAKTASRMVPIIIATKEHSP